MKFADNPKLENGLLSQLQIYNGAENAVRNIYLIIKTNNTNDDKIEKLIKVLNYRKQIKGNNVPDIVVIDSAYKSSASVRQTG